VSNPITAGFSFPKIKHLICLLSAAENVFPPRRTPAFVTQLKLILVLSVEIDDIPQTIVLVTLVELETPDADAKVIEENSGTPLNAGEKVTRPAEHVFTSEYVYISYRNYQIFLVICKKKDMYDD